MKLELDLSQDQVNRLFALCGVFSVECFLGARRALEGRYIYDALSPLVSRDRLGLPLKEVIDLQKEAIAMFSEDEHSKAARQRCLLRHLRGWINAQLGDDQ